MLVKAAMGRPINQIALSQNAAAALIEINAPAAIAHGGDVVPKIVHDPGAGLLSEGVNAGHVAQDRTITVGFHTDVMHMIERDEIVRREIIAITPSPTDGNARVIEIMDMIVHDPIVG